MALFDRHFYYPTRQIYDSPEVYGLSYEPVVFAAGDGVRLSAWWFPANPQARATVVHCHGNAANITAHFTQTAWLAAEGFNVLCFDYRGYGRSEGRVTRAGSIADAVGAVDYVRSQAGPEHALLLFGQSLGGAIAIVVAAGRDDVAGVAVDGPFSGYKDEVRWVLRQQWLTRPAAWAIARWGVSRGYDPIDVVHRVSPTPLMLMHGREDRICPWHMSQQLYDRAREPKELLLIPGIGHYQALEDRGDLARPRLVQFFDRCLRSG